MTPHWTDALPSPHAEDDYAHLPFGDNVYVRRLADAERCLSDLHFSVPAVEAERQALLGRTSAIFSRMSETQVSLVVAGSWNAGKSTVINAFLGERWMPMNVNRETVTVNRILAGGRRQLRVLFRPGHEPAHQTDDYGAAEDVHGKIQDLGEKHRDAIERIDIHYPGHPFLTWVALIDTPGLDFSARDDAVSQPLVDEADVLLWVMHLEGPRQQDLASLHAFRQRNPHGRVIAVINYADLLETAERVEVWADKRDRLKGMADAVFLVSALNDLASRDSDAGFRQLRAYLNEQILPAYGDLRHRRPSRLAREFLAQAWAFAERVRDQPLLKARQAYRLAGKDCWTAEALVGAVAHNWDAAVAGLGNGSLSRWLRDDLNDQGLAKHLDGLMADPLLDHDKRLLRLLALLSPGRGLVWRGISLEKVSLIELAHKALGNSFEAKTARDSIERIYHRQILSTCAVAGYPDHGIIQDRWETAFGRCKAAFEAKIPKEQVTDEKILDTVLASLLLMQLDEEAHFSMQSELEEGDFRTLRYNIPWLWDLGGPDPDPTLLPLLIKLLPAARRQYRWDQVQKSHSSELCETFLKDYPTGPFIYQARKWLPDLLRNELVNDPANPPLRRRYLRWRTGDQWVQDAKDWCVMGFPVDWSMYELARQYGPLPDWETLPANPRQVLLGE